MRVLLSKTLQSGCWNIRVRERLWREIILTLSWFLSHLQEDKVGTWHKSVPLILCHHPSIHTYSYQKLNILRKVNITWLYPWCLCGSNRTSWTISKRCSGSQRRWSIHRAPESRLQWRRPSPPLVDFLPWTTIFQMLLLPCMLQN